MEGLFINCEKVFLLLLRNSKKFFLTNTRYCGMEVNGG